MVVGGINVSQTFLVLFPSKCKQGSSWDLRVGRNGRTQVFDFENLKPFSSAQFEFIVDRAAIVPR